MTRKIQFAILLAKNYYHKLGKLILPRRSIIAYEYDQKLMKKVGMITKSKSESWNYFKDEISRSRIEITDYEFDVPAI